MFGRTQLPTRTAFRAGRWLLVAVLVLSVGCGQRTERSSRIETVEKRSRTDRTLYSLSPRANDSLSQKPIYVGTPPEVVDRMVELADVSVGDTIYDLGSGDGRMVIAVARQYGAYGVGIELDSQLIARARESARATGVDHRVEFRQQDFHDTRIGDASAVLLYLLPGKLKKLRPKLEGELEPGTPVITHDYQFKAWTPEREETIQLPRRKKQLSVIYQWRVPE